VKTVLITNFFQRRGSKVFDFVYYTNLNWKRKVYLEEKITSFCLPWKPPFV